MKYDKFIRILHFGLAFTVLLQLVLSLGMDHPKPGEIYDKTEVLLFTLHELNGLTLAMLVIFGHWMLILSGDSTVTFSHLFPCFTAKGRKGMLSDMCNIPHWLTKGLPTPSEHDYLAAAVHGLGLLVATAMVISGTLIFALMDDDGGIRGLAHDFKEIHEVFAIAMWAYVAGHLLMTVWHQLQGHDMRERMFSLKKDEE
ncbi:MAG: cytochrome b/b6 domain-containing protein [Mariprofundales bacterium]